MSGIGGRLKDIRVDAGLDQKTMSRTLGLGETTWQRLELEDRAPKGEILAALINMGYSVDWLLTGVGTMKTSVPLPSVDTPIDKELMATISEGISKLYKEENARINPGDLMRASIDTYTFVLMTCKSEADYPIAIGALLAAMRAGLRTAPSTESGSSKRSA